ncbi:MAG: BREX-1 system adenine-specific DNA-methyltransferase PglX, partial [Bacteroidota bacterium]
DCGWYYTAKPDDFQKIPGSPIAYWIKSSEVEIFGKNKLLKDAAYPKKGLDTGCNSIFLRLWHEISNKKFSIDSVSKWYPYSKGGDFRKWYGNRHYVVNWENNGKDIHEYNKVPMDYNGAPVRAKRFYFRPGFTWTTVSSGGFSARFVPEGAIFDNGGCTLFSDQNLHHFGALLNSIVSSRYLLMVSPTLNFQPGDIGKIPIADKFESLPLKQYTERLIDLSIHDWNSYEISWDFKCLPLLELDNSRTALVTAYQKLRKYWQNITLEMKRLEEENNRIFIEAYGLQDELTPDVPLEEITLTCNPHYRYGGNKTEEELESLLRTDTIKELISYAIGCMMGRYSLDEPGLIYAHEGNIGFDPYRYKTFPADDDAIIPVMDRDWFEDDATRRFVEFLKTAWPAENIDENLKFVADSLGPKRGEEPVDTIRRYLSQQFFKDHLRMYKRRPIYWLFSSGKHKAFECLVYLHRYNESTLSRMRSLYVTPLQGNFTARMQYLENEIKAATTASAKKKSQKELDILTKKHEELIAFDAQLRHLADQKITIDLDDGVKVNYAKFGTLLAETKTVTGQK